MWQTQDLCTSHQGSPTQEGHLFVLEAELTVGGASAHLGPICVACLCEKVQTLSLKMPSMTGGRIVSARRLKKLSRKQEESSAASTGARVQPGSGSIAGYKSDNRLIGIFREESKFTFSKSFSLTRAILNKIRGECVGPEEPVVNLEFRDKATGRVDDHWVMIDRHFWEKLINGATNYR